MRNLLPIVLLAGCGTPAGTCDLHATAVELAGPGATDCGEAEADAPSDVDACVAAELAAGRAFFGLTARSGIDSVVRTAHVSDGDRLWRLSQDSFGGEGARIAGWECVDPTPTPEGEEPYACARTEPEGTHFDVCGDSCPDGACDDDMPRAVPFEP